MHLSYEYTKNTVLYYVGKVTFDVVHVMFHASKGKFEILTPRKPISTQNNLWLMIVINEFLGNTVNSAANRNQIFVMSLFRLVFRAPWSFLKVSFGVLFIITRF